jgi:hypothetical protein
MKYIRFLQVLLILLLVGNVDSLQLTAMYRPLDESESCHAECKAGGYIYFRDFSWSNIAQITVPANMHLVKSDGSVVGDELCAGDKFTFQKNIKNGEYTDNGGETWTEGGAVDSPPIVWIDDVGAAAKEIINCPGYASKGYLSKLMPAMYTSSSAVSGTMGLGLCGSLSDYTLAWNISNPMTQNITNPTVPSFSATFPAAPPALTSGNNWCEGLECSGDITTNSITKPMYGGITCSVEEKNLEVTNVGRSGLYYVVTGKGDINFTSITDVQCLYYYDKPSDQGPDTYSRSGVLAVGLPLAFDCEDFSASFPMVVSSSGDPAAACGQLSKDSFRVGALRFKKNIRVVDPANQKIDVSVIGADNVKFDEENMLKVLVVNKGDVNVSIKDIDSKAQHRLLSCDRTVIAPNDQAECVVSVTPRSDSGLDIVVLFQFKTCGKTTNDKMSVNLINSMVVRPSYSARAYKVDVRGSCENTYYVCDSKTPEKTAVVGYKCLKKNDYYSPTIGRFDMSYNLSKLPEVMKIKSASVKISPDYVGKAQRLGLYLFDGTFPEMSCNPGGDICTQPYCPECTGLYDISANELSSVEITGVGKWAFDVTDAIKKIYEESGSKSFSVQLRGAENLWDSGDTSSCQTPDAWTKLDVEFPGKGDMGPYLEIVYT